MISPFLAAGREQSASELFPDSNGTKLKSEGEKNSRFSRLLHRCEQQSESPLPENSMTDAHYPVPHTAFSAVLREMNGAVAYAGGSMNKGGTDAVVSGEELDILISGAIPEEESLSADDPLSSPGNLTSGGTAGNESSDAAAGLMIRNDIPISQTREEQSGQKAGTAEEKETPALSSGSSSGLSSKGAMFQHRDEAGAPEKGAQDDQSASGTSAETGKKAFTQMDGAEKYDPSAERGRISEKGEKAGRAAPEKHLSDVPAGEKDAAAAVSRNGAEQGKTAGVPPADRSPDGQEKNSGTEGRETRPLSFSSGKEGLQPGSSRSGDGEKGEGRQPLFGKNDVPGAALFTQRPAQGAEGVRAERSPLPGGFARELALAGRGGAALEDGMHNVVRFMRTEGHHRASMIVDPPALGRVEIELSATTGGVEASIRVGNEQLRQLVQDQITVLRTHLQQQGVQVAELTVDIRDSGKEGHGETRDGAKNRNLRGSGMVGAADEEIPSFAVDLEKGLLHWVA